MSNHVKLGLHKKEGKRARPSLLFCCIFFNFGAVPCSLQTISVLACLALSRLFPEPMVLAVNVKCLQKACVKKKEEQSLILFFLCLMMMIMITVCYARSNVSFFLQNFSQCFLNTCFENCNYHLRNRVKDNNEKNLFLHERLF